MADPTPTPVPESPPDPDAERRQWIREQYGIEDPPDTYKARRAKWEEAEKALPQYDQALREVLTYAAKLQPSTTPPPVVDEDAQFDEIARVDPGKAFRMARAKDREEFARLLLAEREQTARAVHGTLSQRQAETDYGARLRSDWPEAYDTTSELHKLGQQIYRQEMTDTERAFPHGFYAAAERAAGRLGLPPMSRRSAAGADDSGDQNIGRPTAKKPTATVPKLSEREREI